MPAMLRSLLALLLTLPAAAQGPPPAKVTVAPVVMHPFADRLQLIGEAEAFRSGRASAEVEGLVDEVHFVTGQAVGTKADLVVLKTTLRDIRRRQAKAEFELAKQQLAEYQAGSRPEAVRGAKHARDEAIALKKQADEDLGRVLRLRETEAATAEDLTAAQARATVTAAIVAQRKAAYELVVAGPREELKLRAQAQVDFKQAALDEIDDEIRRARIRAPFAGVVTKKLVERGHFVRRGDAVFELVEIDPIRVVVPVPEQALHDLQSGAALEIRFDALPGKQVQAKVESVVPMADARARTFPVKVKLPNPGGEILPGMTARVSLPLSKAGRKTAVPRDAIVRGPQGTLVYAVRGGAAVPVPVRLGSIDGALIEVAGALGPGEQVVTRGNERLMPGQPVIVLAKPAGNGPPKK